MKVRGGRRLLTVVVLAMAAVLALVGLSVAGTQQPPGARELAKEDPGARLNGTTIVLTGNGADAWGVPDRPNFIAALDSGETVHGDSANSEIGALGTNDKIIAGKGHELIVGGAGSTIIGGEGGHDLIFDSHGDATVDVKSPDDMVVVKGRNDHVICSGNATHDQIYDSKSDSVSVSCRRNGDAVASAAKAFDFTQPMRGPVAHAAAAVSGDGSDANPYTALCDNSADHDCTVSSFPSRTLSGLWANEYVPAYKCPSGNFSYGLDHPYLVNHNYAPAGTSLPPGVEVQGLGPIGVSILRTSTEYRVDPLATPSARYYPTGTIVEASSATNWTLDSPSYKVILHCTDTLADSYYSTGG